MDEKQTTFAHVWRGPVYVAVIILLTVLGIVLTGTGCLPVYGEKVL